MHKSAYMSALFLFDIIRKLITHQMKEVLTLNVLLRNRLAPSISAQLSVAAEDLRCAEVVEDISFSLPDTFIQPFREDRDSRNEYKSQVRVLLSVLLSVLFCPSVCLSFRPSVCLSFRLSVCVLFFFCGCRI